MPKHSAKYVRVQRQRHIARKKRIELEVCGPGTHWYKYDGAYSKGKIHCSCPLCREKRKDGYIPMYEKRRQDSMNQKIEEYINAE